MELSFEAPSEALKDRYKVFFGDCATFLRFDQIQSAAELKGCVSGYQRFIIGRLLPESADEIVQIVKQCNKARVSIHPVSTGKNWGFGSDLPPRSPAIIVDLRRMNKICEVNDEFGYAVIEPGVTQTQLFEELNHSAKNFFLDVTGSSGSTSIIGNALERGIAYHTLRVETIVWLEVVLGNGNIIRTGFSHFGDFQIRNLYKYGIGPGLDGLFFQSNFGIVTKAAIQLLPKSSAQASFFVEIGSDQDVSKVMEVLRDLLRRRVIRCIPHVFNRKRLSDGLMSTYQRALGSYGIESAPEECVRLFSSHFSSKSNWFMAGAILGDDDDLQLSSKKLKTALRPFGTVIFTQSWPIRLAGKILRFLYLVRPTKWLASRLAFLDASKTVSGLTCGIPTENTLPSVIWAAHKRRPLEGELEDLDRATAGFIYVTPFAPLSTQATIELLNIIRSTFSEFSFEPSVTLNVVTAQTVEAVVSIHFDRSSETQRRNALECSRTLGKRLIDAGFPLYRTNIEDMDLVTNPKSEYWKAVREIKQLLDPNGIISPGRYDL